MTKKIEKCSLCQFDLTDGKHYTCWPELGGEIACGECHDMLNKAKDHYEKQKVIAKKRKIAFNTPLLTYVVGRWGFDRPNDTKWTKKRQDAYNKHMTELVKNMS